MELNFKTYGSGYPLIIIHGLFGSLDNWQTMGKLLAKDFSVFLLDMRNHGKSPHLAPHNYEAMAEDVLEWMERHYIFKTHLVGHSMGGKVAMQIGFDYSEYVNKMVVVDIGPNKGVVSHRSLIDAMLSLDLELYNSRDQVDAVLSEKIVELSIRQFLLKNIRRSKSGGYEWKINLSLLSRSYNHILESVGDGNSYDGDTLFVRGGLSNYIEASNISHIGNTFPKGEIVTIDKAGHWVHADAGMELYDVLKNFLLK